MALFDRLTHILADPPPEYLFEISEAGVSFGRRSEPGQLGFQPLAPDILSVSPLRDNVLNPDAFAAAIRSIVPANGRKRHKAALILPDFCARLTVLDFDTFPKDPAEQATLVRFRVKKSVPFDVDSAAVSYHAQPAPGPGTKLEVVVTVASHEILARYEAPFRAAGLHPGMVTVSALTALSLLPPRTGPALVAKLGGRVLTVSALDGPVVRLLRCVELPDVTQSEVLNILQPTLAYMEDELGQRPGKVWLAGFGEPDAAARDSWREDLGVEVEAMRSRFGLAGQNNAGLLGYLESAGGY